MTSDYSWSRPTKLDLIVEIAHLIGRTAPAMSTGSTEPREIFESVNDELGLGLEMRRLDKPGLARAIVEASGGTWTPDCESRGSTVTLDGLIAVRDAVKFFVT